MNKKLSLIVLSVLLLAGILAACGDNTATPAPTTAAATSAAATTATTAAAATSATTAAATTAVATTVAATSAATAATSATTAASSATTATTAAAGAAGSASLPAISGTTEIQLDPAFLTEFVKQIPVGSNASLKAYVSNDPATTVATNADTALKAAGYAVALPGQTGPSVQGDSSVGFYSKTGSQDLLFVTANIPADQAELDKTFSSGNSGLSPDAQKKFIDQVKGKKTLLIVISAPNILQSVISAGGAGAGGTTAAGTATAAPTPTK